MSFSLAQTKQINRTRAQFSDFTKKKPPCRISSHDRVLFLFTINLCKTLYIHKPLSRCVGKAQAPVVNLSLSISLSIRLCHLLKLANETSASFQLFRSFILSVILTLKCIVDYQRASIP